jgi:hypothetical protein
VPPNLPEEVKAHLVMLQRAALALWEIGHGPNCSFAWIVFFRGGGHKWDTRETLLPGPTYAGIIERL